MLVRVGKKRTLVLLVEILIDTVIIETVHKLLKGFKTELLIFLLVDIYPKGMKSLS